MKVLIHEINDQRIAEVLSDGFVIHTAQDALELMMHPDVSGSMKIILHKTSLEPNFFELRTGLAGEILQKFVNYHIQLAIVGDFSTVKSESLKALIRESKRGKQTFFVENTEAAIGALSDNE